MDYFKGLDKPLPTNPGAFVRCLPGPDLRTAINYAHMRALDEGCVDFIGDDMITHITPTPIEQRRFEALKNVEEIWIIVEVGDEPVK